MAQRRPVKKPVNPQQGSEHSPISGQGTDKLNSNSIISEVDSAFEDQTPAAKNFKHDLDLDNFGS